MSDSHDSIDLPRRRMLKGLAAAAGATLTGCSGAAVPSAPGATTVAPPSPTHAATEVDAFQRLAAQLADPATAISTGEAWVAFCDALKPLARHVTGDAAQGDPQAQTEGVRCLGRLVSLGLDRFLENGDPRHPSFYEIQTATRKYLGDNPDQSYRGAPLDGAGHYRIRGSAAGTAGVEIGIYAGSFRSDDDGAQGGRRLVDSIDEAALEIDDDGSFELVVSPEGVDAVEAANVLHSAPDANALLIRSYFWDRDLRQAHAFPTIERLDVSGPRPPVAAATVVRGFLATTAFVDGSLGWWNRFTGIQTAPNELIAMPDDGAVQTPSLVRYLNGQVELSPDEALVLEFTPRDEPSYWSWVLQNPFGESLDWRDRPIVKNNRDLAREKDGRVRIVVAHEDPGVANWMDMAGHRRLLLSLRWRGASALPEVSTRRTTLAALRG